MRSFTSSSPVWSASRISRAATTSRCSSERVPHGISSTVSSQVRIHPCSGLCSLVRSNRSTSRSTAARTSSGSTMSLSFGRYSATASSASPVSPSSSRIAASCWRSRNSRCVLSMPSVTRLRICSDRSSSASVSRTKPSAISRRASGSSSSSSSTLRSTDRSGAQPAVSASAPGSSTPASTSAMRGLPSFSAMPRTTARYSRTISLARPDTAAGSATGSASTQRPGWSLGTVRPTTARERPRSTSAR